VWGFLGHGPREYHIALSEALSEAAVASLCDWLRLFSPAAGQHPKCRAAGSDSDQDPPAQRLAAAAIPSPGAGSDSDTRLSGYSQAPGGPEFDKSESCAVHWQSNLSEWSRPAVDRDGLTILLSGGDSDSKYRDASGHRDRPRSWSPNFEVTLNRGPCAHPAAHSATGTRPIFRGLGSSSSDSDRRAAVTAGSTRVVLGTLM
jgi:hypothetical protein